jgi:hypothetical protein
MGRVLTLFFVVTTMALAADVAQAEGIYFYNYENGNGGWYSGSPSGDFLSPTAARDGAYWLDTGSGPVLGEDNFYLEAYAEATNGSWLPFSSMPIFETSSAIAWGSSAYAGYFEQSASSTLPSGSLAGSLGNRHIKIKAWMGSYADYAAAYADGAYCATVTFWNPTSDFLPPSLTEMPALVFTAAPVPEPSTMVLTAAAAIGVLACCWRKRK